MNKVELAFDFNRSFCVRVSEQRRKRLHELETQLSALRRRIQEQEKTIKVKEQSVAKVGKLNTDIQVRVVVA